MLLLAGLLGVVAVGATAFLGMGGDDPAPDEGDPAANQQDIGQQAIGQQGQGSTGDDTGPGGGNSIMDFADAPDEDVVTAAPDTGDGSETAPAEGVDSLPPTDNSAATGERIESGSSGNDTMIGTAGVDLMNGYGGNDLMTGDAGNDQLLGDTGDDTLFGDAGDDTLQGGDGADDLHGGDGGDHLFGHGGDDALSGDAGDDSLVGGAGDDTLQGGEGADALHGGLGDDSLSGGLGRDQLFGGWGDDTLTGVVDDPDTGARDDLDLRDFLNGGGGDDEITAGRDDIVTTGDGADTVILGEWLSEGHQADILDFDIDQDLLRIVFDDSIDPDPDVSIQQDSDDPALQHVVLNGVRIAAVYNCDGLNLSHIALVPQSVLQQAA